MATETPALDDRTRDYLGTNTGDRKVVLLGGMCDGQEFKIAGEFPPCVFMPYQKTVSVDDHGAERRFANSTVLLRYEYVGGYWSDRPDVRFYRFVA